ncbi:uncharacterized protein (TIGR03083 family) [Amycolatopsis sulphurea]|uniref:Uncharacterized protein (TIGR03083 family) n=1 Tax=Amycolatopsis sulphurea TaxID=76022 RepID=A0A2A9FHX8_9PSEU|nr:maleylpyruvate isomerase family mycothiol-dependent enzyme [Amycolatopsis sulphurea]PFG50331.1 uncharacterized protein (TIGR03083 family) [Amycolatopsis sulphurea]
MPTFPFPAPDYLPHLRALTEAFAEEVRAGRFEAAVPCCGDWTRRDLVAHLGVVHRSVATIVETGQQVRVEAEMGEDPAGWYAESAARLLDVLAAADPDEPCRQFVGIEMTKAFWFRRQVHETAVHLIDAHAARGGVVRLEPLVAADGVDEVLGRFLPVAARFVAIPSLAAPIALHAGDLGCSWTLVPGAPPVLGEAEPVATVEATVQELLMLLWKRGGISPRITGAAEAEEAARGFLAAKLTP